MAQARLVVAIVVLLDYLLDRSVYFRCFSSVLFICNLGLIVEFPGCAFICFLVEFSQLN
jgi:hypothetical protein